jgi:hypothetical protein
VDTIKYLAAVLIGIAGLGLQQSQAHLLDNPVRDISHATFFGSLGGQGVPDGGATVMLLGAALGALGMLRRYLKS